MSEEYAGKSNQQIIDEQAADLASKSNYQTSDKFHPRQNTVTSDESNINESGVEGRFPGAEVSVGRTGMTGGGTNDQMLPSSEGGDDRSQRPGTTSGAFEGEGRFGGQEEQMTERLRENPGGFDAKPRGIDESRQAQMNEPVPRTTGQALEEDQEGTARGHAYNS